MKKLYFKYGVMGCSKTAQALMTKYNYEKKGYKVFLIKSNIDTRDVEDGKIIVKARIGLKSDCHVFDKNTNLESFLNNLIDDYENSIVIVDEVQFCTKKQIDELHKLSRKLPVLCYGLLTNFKTEMFESSKRLIETADSLQEIKTICKCGKKATINARFCNGKIETSGEDIEVGDKQYEAICYDCYWKLLEEK